MENPPSDVGAARIRLALTVFGLMVLGVSAFGLYRTRHAAPPPVVVSLPAASDAGADALPFPSGGTETPRPRQTRTAPARVFVHVAGAVKHPWLYGLPPGSRVMQAVLAAGGPAHDADLDAVNLAEPVRDGEKVYIPTKTALIAAIRPVPPGNVIGHTSVMPSPMAAHPAPSLPPALPTVIEPGGGDTVAAGPSVPPILKVGKHKGTGKADKLTSPDQGQIALNTADAAQLERLPDVGPAMAARILAFRVQAHGFQSIDELQEVSGIGPKKYAKIAPLVTLN